MVLPINPGNIPVGPQGIPQVSQSPGHPAITSRQIQSFSGLPPDEDFIPKIYQPSKISIQQFSLILANSINRLREILFFSTKIDEEITKRFYLANIAINRSSNSSTDLIERIYLSEITDPAYLSYINDGINGSVTNMNNAIQTYILGANNASIDQEYQIIDELNNAIQNYGAISNPTPTDIATLNSLISTYNAYASTRNNDISLYNNAVNTYNTEVGMPDINGAYPSGSLNHQISEFNRKYEGLGLLEPLPYFQNLLNRDLLPEPLPFADPDPVLTSQLSAHLSTPLSETYSPYSAYRALNQEFDQSTLFSPTFGMTSDVNSLISYYNDNFVAFNPTGISPIIPTEQQAIAILNQAIQNYNDSTSPTFANIDILNEAIDNYETAININPNLNNYITQFNEEVVGVPTSSSEGYNNTIGIRINLGIDDINLYLPTGITYNPNSLSAQDAMPPSPTDAVGLTQVNLQSIMTPFDPPLISDRTFRPIILPNTVTFEDIPLSFDPVETDGVISINQFPSLTNIHTIPAPVSPDPYGNINSYFDDLNGAISTYNTSVGELVNPVPNSENDAIEQLNGAIDTWNSLTNRTATDLTNLQNAIDNYNLLSYGGPGFTPSIPAPGSFDERINTINAQIDYFNTSLDPSPAETLINLNNEINTQNIARVLFGLPKMPLYEAKPLRDLMADAPVIPPGSDPSLLSSFSQIPKREIYAPILDMSQFIIEANFLFDNEITLNGKIQNSLITTIEQTSDPNFIGYQSLLEGPGSIPDVYNQALNDYFSATLPNPGSMPSVAISGPNVLLDPTTQNAVIDDLMNAINQIPPLSSIALQQKIDEYNNYSSLVNSSSIANLNAIIDNLKLNQIGIADSLTGEYPPGTLNAYATDFEKTYGGNGLIGPLKILDLSAVETMQSGLPPVSTLVSINGQPESFYNLANILNTTMQNVVPSFGNPSLNDLNALILSYNDQVGDISGINPDSENGIIFIINQAIQNAFPSDASSSLPSSDPNVYFSALDNLYSANQNYNADRDILNSGGVLGASTVTGVDTLNALIQLFNANSLSSINSSIENMLGEVNNAIEPFGFSSFKSLSDLSLRSTMDSALNTQANVPNELPLLSTRDTYSEVAQQFSMSERILPTLLPEFFTISGANSDLENLNDTVYIPLTETIEDYNQSIDDQFGLYAENQAITELDAAIESFNQGFSTSDDLKEAISTYVQTISTDVPSINENIHTLNQAIQNYQTLFAQANTSLEYWGLYTIPQEFMINQRRVMPSPPIPVNSGLLINSDYEPPITFIAKRNPQNFPHTTSTITDPITGETSTIFEAVPLKDGALVVTVAKEMFRRKILFKEKGYKILENSLKRIELFDELQEFLRGKRIEFPNAYIEYGVTPPSPAAISQFVSAAALSIGLSSHHFDSLLMNEMFNQILKHFEMQDLGFLRLFQTLAFEINNKIASKSFGPTLLLLNNQVPFLSLNAFRNPDTTPIAPVVTASVIQQVVSFVRSRVTEEIVQEILSPKAPKALVEAVSSAFNLSFISNGLVLVGNLLGKNVPKTLFELNGNTLKIDQFDPKESILNSRLREEEIKNSLIEARREQLGGNINPDEINKMNSISQEIILQRNAAEKLTDTINQRDALRYQQKKDGIKNELISKTDFSNIEINRNLEGRSLQERIIENEKLNNIDRRDLANRTLKKLIERNAIITDINNNQLVESLLKNEIILDDEKSQLRNQALIAEAQRRFDRQQSKDKNPEETFTNVLQSTFGIPEEKAKSIAQTPNLFLQKDVSLSKLDNLEIVLSEQELRDLINRRVDEKLNKFDVKLRIKTKKILNDNLLDSDVSLKNLLHDQLKRLNSLNDDALNAIMLEEFKNLFATQDKPYVFLQKLQDPLYFGIYCIGAGLMYDKAEKRDYLRDIEIHI